MKPLARRTRRAMGFGCGRISLSGAVVFPVRLEDGRRRWFGSGAAGANAGKEGLAVGFSVLRHTSAVRARARLGSETRSRSGSVNKAPQVNGPKHNLLRGEPLDDDRSLQRRVWRASSRFEFTSRDARLSNNGLQRPDAELPVIRDGDGYRSLRRLFLHHDVASASSNLHEAVPSYNRTNLFA